MGGTPVLARVNLELTMNGVYFHRGDGRQAPP